MTHVCIAVCLKKSDGAVAVALVHGGLRSDRRERETTTVEEVRERERELTLLLPTVAKTCLSQMYQLNWTPNSGCPCSSCHANMTRTTSQT